MMDKIGAANWVSTTKVVLAPIVFTLVKND